MTDKKDTKNMRETLIEIYHELKGMYPDEDHPVLGINFNYPESLPGIQIKLRFEKQPD